MRLLIILCLMTFTASSQCVQPFGSSANPNGNNVTISWTKRTCANGYKIRYRPLGTTTWKYKTVADTNQTTIYFLSYSTDYEFGVASISGTTTSVYSWSKTFRTLCECLVPIVVIDSIGANQVLFYIDDDNCGVQYKIQYKLQGAQYWTTLSVKDTAQTLLSPLLATGATYEWRSRRECKADGSYRSDWSVIYPFTTNTVVRTIKYKSIVTIKTQ